ncbi:hypothetical protein V1522DRAFT_328324, partial [Lipomyces starkeyi]
NASTAATNRWSYRGVPCAHAVAAISFAGKDMREFVDRYFKIKEFEATYRYGIHAMSTICLNEDIASPACRPPNTRRPP